MTARQEFVNKYEELIKEQNDIYRKYISDDTFKRMSKQDYARVHQLDREIDALVLMTEKLDKVIWCEENWASQYVGTGDSYEDARKNLFDKLKDKAGVTVEFDKKNMVKKIMVRSHTKVYFYDIRCHYGKAVLEQTLNCKRADDVSVYMRTGKIEQMDDELLWALRVIK